MTDKEFFRQLVLQIMKEPTKDSMVDTAYASMVTGRAETIYLYAKNIEENRHMDECVIKGADILRQFHVRSQSHETTKQNYIEELFKKALAYDIIIVDDYTAYMYGTNCLGYCRGEAYDFLESHIDIRHDIERELQQREKEESERVEEEE